MSISRRRFCGIGRGNGQIRKRSQDLYGCFWVSPRDTVHVWNLLPWPLHIKSSSGGIPNSVVCHGSTPMALWHEFCALLTLQHAPNQLPSRTLQNLKKLSENLKLSKNFRNLPNACRTFRNSELFKLTKFGPEPSEPFKCAERPSK